jgi:hypothetical protein
VSLACILLLLGTPAADHLLISLRNCAPINITGGTGDEKQIEGLPDIFIANYPNDPEVPNCITGTHADKVVLNFPNPGKYGLLLQNPIEPSNKPSGYCTQIPRASVLPVFEPAPRPLCRAATIAAQPSATRQARARARPQSCPPPTCPFPTAGTAPPCPA